MSENARIDALAVASPMVAVVSALLLAGFAAIAHAVSISAAVSKAEMLLEAGGFAFLAGQVMACLLAAVGIIRIKLRRGTRGIPEAILGFAAVGLLSAGALSVFSSVTFVSLN